MGGNLQRFTHFDVAILVFLHNVDIKFRVYLICLCCAWNVSQKLFLLENVLLDVT